MKVSYLRPDPSIPAYYHAYEHDAGYDVYALQDILIFPFQTKKIPLNIQVNIPPGYCALLTGRSGHNFRGLMFHIGTIDAGYTGKVHAIVTNLTLLPKKIRKGDRIGQLVFLSIPDVLMEFSLHLPPTERGSRGLGSTGK